MTTQLPTTQGSLRFNAAKAAAPTQKYLFHRMINLRTTKVKAIDDTNSVKNAFQVGENSTKFLRNF